MTNRYINMKQHTVTRLFQAVVSLVFLCFMTISSAGAETVRTPSPKTGYATSDLDQMLAPVALYPDGLLVQVLMAASYPREITEAGKWLDAHPGMSGDKAVESASDFGWNSSVQSLLSFPDVLSTLSSNISWTIKLGIAFDLQREEVMDRVQYLRRKAKAAGNLRSDERMKVVTTGNHVVIEPVSKEIIYVPYYNPVIVYGSWWWPGYAPYHWAPWRGYIASPGYYSGGFMWGSGIWFSYTRFYGRADWGRRHVQWNPPPRYPVSVKAKPERNPHPRSYPHAGTEMSRPYQAHSANRPGSTPSPIRFSPGNSHPSDTMKNHPGREESVQMKSAEAKPGKRPVSESRPSRRASEIRPPERPAFSGRSSGETWQTASATQRPLGPDESRSHQAGSRDLSESSGRGDNGRKGGGRR